MSGNHELEKLVKDSRLPQLRKIELQQIINGERLADLYYDVIAKRIFSPDLYPERMDFILQRTMNDPSLSTDKSASNEAYLSNIYAKKTITDIPAWLRNGWMSNIEMQLAAQEYIFNRADIYASNMLLLQYSKEESGVDDVNYRNVNGAILIVLMVNSPKQFREYESDRYIHRITKTKSDSGMEFELLRQIVFVQLDKALELYIKGNYNEDEDVELLKLFAMIADINNEKLKEETQRDDFFEKIREDVFAFTRDREVLNMLTAEDFARMDYYTDISDAKKQGRNLGVEEGRKQGIEEGRKEGIKLGIEEGIKLGIEQGKAIEKKRVDELQKELDELKAKYGV